MKEYTASAKTVEEAIELGLRELNASIGDVDVQVVEEGSKGLFGLFGSRLAKVKLTLKEAEEDLLSDLIGEEPAQTKPEEKKTADRKPAEKKPAEKKPAEKKAAEPAREERKPQEKKGADRKPAEKKPADRKPRPEKAQPAETAGSPAEAAPEGQKSPIAIQTLEKPEVTMIPAEALEADSPAGRAHAFLQELTRLMGVEVTIDMGTDAEGNVFGYINGDTLGILIGRRGETLDAVQYLTSLKVNRGQDNYTRVTLDTENYRAKREDTLIRLANRMANRAVRTGRRVSLEPMNPYERRIIHYALQQNEAVDTHSEGDEPGRHVVITLNK